MEIDAPDETWLWEGVLGQPLSGECPPVVIIGPDVSRVRWMTPQALRTGGAEGERRVEAVRSHQGHVQQDGSDPAGRHRAGKDRRPGWLLIREVVASHSITMVVLHHSGYGWAGPGSSRGITRRHCSTGSVYPVHRRNLLSLRNQCFRGFKSRNQL